MKKHYLLILSIFTVFAITSCSSDDDSGSNSNGTNASSDSYLEIEGDNYQLRSGVIEDYGEGSNETFNFDITLISTNVTSINGEFIPEGDSYTGIYFELWSDNSSDLAEGTYSYSNSEDGFTYTYSEIHKDISTDTFTGEYIDITSGELEVNKNGNNYEFTFTGTTFDGDDISMYYSGSLVEH